MVCWTLFPSVPEPVLIPEANTFVEHKPWRQLALMHNRVERLEKRIKTLRELILKAKDLDGDEDLHG